MRERPVIMSGLMVRAILDGQKTQTRRLIKPQPDFVIQNASVGYSMTVAKIGKRSGIVNELCPYGQPGDRLWVRERFRIMENCGEVDYFADGKEVYGRMQDYISLPDAAKWKPSIHMPRWASRIDLTVTDVRVERLQDISEANALAEGIVQLECGGYGLPNESYYDPTDPSRSFFGLWRSIHGDDNWSENPWVWVIEFKRVKL